LYNWLTGSSTPPPSSSTPGAGRTSLPERIAHYSVIRKIGEGGMGVVYEARDERLERTVAVKMTRIAPALGAMGGRHSTPASGDDAIRKRFWREARLAASVNHPNVCQIYEIGEDGGELFIAMELLEGEGLSERLKRGSLSVAEAVPVSLGMLAALAALHSRGVIHRDLKPSNVFLTPHGVKLLDFGLARPELEHSMNTDAGLTQAGMVMGTPRYMAPEQVLGDPVDARSDLFAAGAIMFEMLAGRPAFTGRSVVEVLHATLHEQPPALTGPPVVAAVDRVIRRALAKQPGERPASAEAIAEELRHIRVVDASGTQTLAQPMTRLVVLPFRVLRPDPETDFLAFSLPDAISTSLSGIGSLVVRSSAKAARFAGEAPDLQAVAAEADVDRVVMGTVLRSGDQLRASAQLVEAPSGTLLTAHTVQSSLGDLFRLQDDIARRVVEALSLPLGGATASPAPDAPQSERAYELYLRANEMARSYETLERARDLYQRSLELDPDFAPAWAHFGRSHRVIGKFITATPDSEERAEQAFRRALELSPRLSIAHKFYAALEADTGRAAQAMVRLMTEANRHGNDPELFSGLVHACRYCGLYDESMAAHAEARRLDPNVETSVEQTILMTGDLDRLLAVESPSKAGADEGIRAIALGLAGRRDEARQALTALGETASASRIRSLQAWTTYLLAWLDGRLPGMLIDISEFRALKIQDDPEAQFQEGWLMCDMGEFKLGLTQVKRAVSKGYFVAPTLASSPAFNAVRDDPAFQAIVAEAEAGRAAALEAFREAGGGRLLGR
jgi:serine/threonine protein kinase/tetratricopeptide (TPR) repeat protein